MNENKRTYTANSDLILHLASVAEWLKTAPQADLGYGIYYPKSVLIVFDGEPIGSFVNYEEGWMFEAEA